MHVATSHSKVLSSIILIYFSRSFVGPEDFLNHVYFQQGSTLYNVVYRVYKGCVLICYLSPSSTPDQTIGETELNENSPLVSDTSQNSPLRHSELSPFRVVPPKARKLAHNDTDFDSLLEVKSIPEGPKRVEVCSGRLSLPPMQHKFRSLWLEQQERDGQLDNGLVELTNKLEESKIFDDQSSGFGSGQNKTEIL